MPYHATTFDRLSRENGMLLRTFIAFHVDPGPRLCRVIDQLDQLGPAVRVPPAPGLHLTLRFLGETDAALVSELAELLDELSGRYPAFRRSLTGLGVFPDRRRPTVIWAGLKEPQLMLLQQDVEERVTALGWVPEARPFRPHVTLARINPRRAVPAVLNEMLDQHVTTGFGEQVFDRLVLYQSPATAAGVRYEELHTVTLAD